MNYMPKIDRRSFLVGTAAVGGGLSLGLQLPLGPEAARAAEGTPEINAWVVIRPDETVVIRIARSEMGQGSLTGLAQLVAEELECDWSKVTTEYPTPGTERRSQADMGRLRQHRQPQHPRVAGICAQGRRGRARDAQAGRGQRVEGAGIGGHRREQRDYAQAVRPHHDLRQGGARRQQGRAAAGREAQGSEGLETSLGKRVKRLDTADKLTGKQQYSMDFKLPGMLSAAVKESPVFGGKVKSFDAAKVMGMPGVKKVVQSRRCGGCRRRRHLVAGQDRARGAADRVGRRPERQGLERG